MRRGSPGGAGLWKRGMGFVVMATTAKEGGIYCRGNDSSTLNPSTQQFHVRHQKMASSWFSITNVLLIWAIYTAFMLSWDALICLQLVKRKWYRRENSTLHDFCLHATEHSRSLWLQNPSSHIISCSPYQAICLYLWGEYSYCTGNN